LKNGDIACKAYYGDRKELIQFIPVGCKRVLEVGSAEGGFRQYFNDDCEYWGIEPNKEAADRSRATLFKVICSDFNSAKAQLSIGYFDLIVCNDVIEHMADPTAFLTAVQPYLGSKGAVIGSIPNVRFFQNLVNLLLRKDWKYEDSGILDRTHLKFFTLKSLIRLFNFCNYEIEVIKGINSEVLELGNVKSILRRFFMIILGQDTMHQQFGFKLSVKNSCDV